MSPSTIKQPKRDHIIIIKKTDGNAVTKVSKPMSKEEAMVALKELWSGYKGEVFKIIPVK